MKRFYTHGLEAAPREPRDPQSKWWVRPVHPDGFGYAAITRPIEKELAYIFAAAPEMYVALAQALEALRSAAGPEERQNALRDGKAILAKARGES